MECNCLLLYMKQDKFIFYGNLIFFCPKSPAILKTNIEIRHRPDKLDNR
jgi:hypothetical protein